MARLSHRGRRFLLRRGVVAARSFVLRSSIPHSGIHRRVPPIATPRLVLTVSIAACLGLLFVQHNASGQDSPGPSASGAEDTNTRPPIVTDIDFRGDLIFPEEVLVLRVRSVANRELLGWTGIRWWLGLYRLGASGKLGKRLGSALMAAGEEPAYIDTSLVSADVNRLRLFYQQEGYRDASVQASINQGDNPAHVSIVFDIEPGRPTFIRNVSFEGLDGLPVDAARRIAERSLIRHRREDFRDDLSFPAIRQRYSESRLLEERRRILDALLNRGHAAATRDSIRAIVFSVSPDSFDVRFRIRPGPRYKFGSVTFIVSGPEARDYVRRDTIDVLQSDSTDRRFSVTSTIFSEGKLQLNLLRRSLQFEPGSWYNRSLLDATKRRLESSGVFAFSDVQPLVPGRETSGVPVLPHQIELRTRQRHSVKLQLFFLQRSGLLGTTDRDFGAGVGVTFRNTNLLGEGEAFQFRASVSSSADRVLEVLNPLEIFKASRQSEVEASINFPYLVRPFRGVEGLANFYDVRTRLSLSLLAARRDELRLIVRGRGSGQLRLELQHSPSV
ncbi:MAG: POTRA domain-containing protein, partial [Rhodothermales bacterium]|nr:POTRA domain-containing protein [Rhodothermales bacterium]